MDIKPVAREQTVKKPPRRCRGHPRKHQHASLSQARRKPTQVERHPEARGSHTVTGRIWQPVADVKLPSRSCEMTALPLTLQWSE